MNDVFKIHEILIERDIEAFVAEDWDAVQADFDADAFAGYSAESGSVRLQYPSLDHYRDSWLEQAAVFRGVDRQPLVQQLHAAQSLQRVEVAEGRALVTKAFDGVVDGANGASHLKWTTYYFLRFDLDLSRWLITGFAGYFPSDWNAR